MIYTAGNLGGHHNDAPNFYPEMDSAWVGIRPVQRLFGQPNAISQVTYPPVYKDYRLGPSNEGKLFLILINEAHKLEFGEESSQAKSDAVGALASPQMTILGLSKTIGPVSGELPDDMTKPLSVESKLAKIKSGTFTPNDFFKDATILGGISLSEILDEVTTLTSPAYQKCCRESLPIRPNSTLHSNGKRRSKIVTYYHSSFLMQTKSNLQYLKWIATSRLR